MDLDKLFFKAQILESTNQPDKICNLMETFVKNKKTDLTTEERDLFSNCFKQKISQLRASCSKISEIYQTETRKKCTSLHLVKKLKEDIENELKTSCLFVIDLLDKFLIPNSVKNKESSVLYYKLKGDYYRYLSTFFESKEFSQNALVSYKKSTELAESLSPINPIKIDLALSFSVFNYDVLKNTEDAISIATEALNEGVERLNEISDVDAKDASISLQMLKDNLENWNKETVVDDI